MGKLTKGYKTDKSQPVWKCCRQIRICIPSILRGIYSGLNTETNELEYWMLIKKHKDYNFSIMKRIYKN